MIHYDIHISFTDAFLVDKIRDLIHVQSHLLSLLQEMFSLVYVINRSQRLMNIRSHGQLLLNQPSLLLRARMWLNVILSHPI